MDENKEVKNEEIVNEVEQTEQPKVDERPIENYKAELERKNRELERMRMELASKNEVKPAYNPNDIRTWPDHELKVLLKDPKFSQYHEQAEDLLFERKMETKLAAKAETEKRVSAEMQLREKFPDALDPHSELSIKMDQILRDNDLSKTPAGRLVAAKLAAAELNQGKYSADAKAQNAEKTRVARVKSQMVDGDRAKPADNAVDLDAKRSDLAKKLTLGSQKGHEKDSVEAMKDILNDRFGGREGFFGKKK